jgi:hypothetical protein
MKHKNILLLVFIFNILFLINAGITAPPPEIAMIILMENKFENTFRNKNFEDSNELVQSFIKENITALSEKLDAEQADEIFKFYLNIADSLKTEDVAKIEKAYSYFKNNLYLLYDLFDLKGISPELNFLTFDFNQLEYYLKNNQYEFIVYESEQIINFVSLIQKRLIEKKIFIPEVQYLYNYILRLLYQIRAAALDKDLKSLKERIHLLEICFDELKKSYETQNFDWDFDR